MLPEKLGYGRSWSSRAEKITTGTLVEAFNAVSCGTLASTVILSHEAPASRTSVLMPLMVAQDVSSGATWRSVRASLEKSRCVLSSKLTSTRTWAVLAIEIGGNVALLPGKDTRGARTLALTSVTLGSFRFREASPIAADRLQTCHSTLNKSPHSRTAPT